MNQPVASSVSMPAPALARGVRVFNLISLRKKMSLAEIASETQIPKASLLRILNTLSALELVCKRPGSRDYVPLKRLVPLSYMRQRQQEKLHEVMHHLAEQTSFTAEWFEPSKEGMVLLRHAIPVSHPVHVAAGEGDTFRWGRELDAVTSLGYAFFDAPPCPERMRCYVEDGRDRKVPTKTLKSRIEAVRESECDVDPYWNDAGVRRMACVVRHEDAPVGVLALACNRRPGDAEHREPALARLREACTILLVD